MGKGAAGPVYAFFAFLGGKNFFREKALFWFTNRSRFDILMSEYTFALSFFRAPYARAKDYLQQRRDRM